MSAVAPPLFLRARHKRSFLTALPYPTGFQQVDRDKNP